MRSSREERRLKNIERLHKDFTAGSLALLVGAGVSVPSGFPAWDHLNQRLLLELVRSEHAEDMLSSSLLPGLAKQLYELFGRDSSAEFVRLSAKGNFDQMLVDALYADRSLDELPITSLQFQIASMMDSCRLSTLNLEPLLELARASLLARQGKSVDWKSLRRIPQKGSSGHFTGLVEHLHGWIDPDTTRSPVIVLTEKHYFDLTEDASSAVNASLLGLLTQGGSVLTVGLSWADYNLRRLLYHLQKSDNGTKIFSILREDDVVLEEYTAKRWEPLNLVPIFVKQFDGIAPLLRDVVWGMPNPGELPNWLEPSAMWRERAIPSSTIFSDDWQKVATQALRELKRQIRTLFGVRLEERINIAFFVPMRIEGASEVHLHQVGSSRVVRTGAEAKQHARIRALKLRRGEEQGAAGVAFVLGNNRQLLHGEPGLDVGFDATMKEAWISNGSYRDWRSVLCVPILDSEHWLPVSLVTLTSNMVKPFWTEFQSKDDGLQAELYAMLRKTGSWLLSST